MERKDLVPVRIKKSVRASARKEAKELSKITGKRIRLHQVFEIWATDRRLAASAIKDEKTNAGANNPGRAATSPGGSVKGPKAVPQKR